MTSRSTVGPKGQVTLPKDLREKYHLLEGETVVVVPAEGGVLIKHTPTSLRGRWKGKIDVRAVEKDIEQIRKEWRL
jgi:AbrB family looped-hinge helix DNA binding protein